jgi:hypothetical protein
MRFSKWGAWPVSAMGVIVAFFGCSKPDSGAPGAAASSTASAGGSAATSPPSAMASTAAAVTGMGAAGAGKPPPACSLASSAEISAAFGESFSPKSQQTAPAYPTVSVCDYQPSGGKTLIIRTEIIDKAGWQKSVSLAKGAHAVAGVGDEAYFQANEIMHVSEGQFLAYKGTTFVSINFGGMGVDMGKIEASEKGLMVKLLTKI